LSFSSCIGLSVDIKMNRDGSGRLTMEYRISRTVQTLGALDGNEKWPTIPVGRADWERTIERINGAKIASFSSSEKGDDNITKVVINFDNPQALSLILGSGAIIKTDNRSGSFNYTINPVKSSEYDQSMMSLVQNMFEGYDFSISLSAPRNAALTVTDGSGKTITTPPSAKAVLSGSKVSLSMNTLDLINLSDGFGINISW